MDQMLSTISETTITIMLALIGLLAAYAVRGINAFVAKMKVESAKIEDDQFRWFAEEAISRVNDLATKTVVQIEQTTAGKLREAVRDGAVDRAELEKLGAQAVNEIIRNLSYEYYDAIEQTVGDVRDYVTKTVEAKVYAIKNQPVPPTIG